MKIIVDLCAELTHNRFIGSRNKGNEMNFFTFIDSEENYMVIEAPNLTEAFKIVRLKKFNWVEWMWGNQAKA